MELWTALEASEMPAIRWWEDYIPTPPPSIDPAEDEARNAVYTASKQVSRQVASVRENGLKRHIKRARLGTAFYKAVLRKNVYGHSWTKSWPDIPNKTFKVVTGIDPSTVFPVWSSWDENELDAVLVAYRRSAALVNQQYPGAVSLGRDGIHIDASSYYQPTQTQATEAERAFAWVEDYWVIDRTYDPKADPVADPRAAAVSTLVINVKRVNGKVVEVVDYPGWTRLPYFIDENENERDHLGFSDVGTMLPIQDSLNRFMSQQQDVIAGESRPRFKYRGDSDRQIVLGADEVVSLDQDEDIEQIAVRLDVFPTQVHGQQLLEVLARSTGLPDVVWGRIVAAQNSGRALSTAWRAVAARLVPRTNRNGRFLKELLDFWLDCMELYGWDNARELYGGERDYELDFPNQEPRDFQEVTLDAVNKLGAGIIDLQTAMELTGEQTPDERIERVKADYLDEILHPEKAQSYRLLKRLDQQMEIEAQQAQLQAQQVQAEQQAAQAEQARTQAAQQAAPRLAEGQNAPATQAGSPANAANTRFSTLVQDGKAFNRIIDQGQL